MRFALLTIGIAALLRPAAAAPLPIAIQNPSFEENAATLIPAPGSFTTNNVPGWTASGSGLFRPDTPVNFAPDGVAVVFLNSGSVKQSLTFPGGAAVTASPGARLSVALKARPRTTAGACVLTLDALAGASPVSQSPVTINLAANPADYTVVSGEITLKDAAGLGAANGRQLTLSISSTGDQANIDLVSAAIALPPVITSLTAGPQPATAGQTVTISWGVTGATSVLLNGSDVTGQSSSIVLAPALPADYTLSASNSDGTVTRSLRLDVVPSAPPAATVRINEVVAENVSGLLDDDGTPQDWIELFNTTGAAVNLGGWKLTDDRSLPGKWTFPPVSLPPGGYLIVFASGKNRTVPGQVLHTNFKLDRDGEYLALSDAGLVLQSVFSPALPKLAADASYGIGRGLKLGQPLILSGSAAAVKWLVPTAAVSDDWRGGNEPFSDAAWTAGQWALGFNLNTATAYSIPASTAGVQAFGGSLGLDFDVVRPVEVTQLGCFDHQSNGIAAGVTISVQLWRRSGTPEALDIDPATAGTQTTLTFTQASGGILSGGCRFKSLSGPVTLPVGNYSIVAYGYGAAELNGNSSGATPFPVTTNSAGGAISFVGTGRYGTAGQFPGSPDGGPAARYGAGTFVFKEAGGATFATNTSAAMLNANATVLTRTAFSLTTVPPCPVLRVTSDDGFVAWINGTEVGRRNAPSTLTHASAATAAGAGTFTFNLGGFPGLLHAGANILAIQGLNVSAADTDFHLAAELTAQDTADGQRVYLMSPTPGAPNSDGLLANHLVITEIHSDPVDSKSQFTEFVEIHNPLSTPVNVGNWSLTGGIGYTIPPGTVIPSCGYLVVAENPAHLGTWLNYPGALGPWIGSLRNSGDEVVLRDAALNVVDRVNYGLGFPWPTVGDFPGASHQRTHPGLESDLGATWRSAAPTPGADNATLSSFSPPAIRQVNHTPQAPLAGQSVTVTAKITDPEGVSAAWLEYQVVEPGGYIRLTDAAWNVNWITLAMQDDGMNGDAAANDGTFAAVIPASAQAHRRLIRYRIRSWDGALNHIRVPYSDDPCPNFAYFCYNGVPAWSGAVQPGATAVDTFSAATMAKVRSWHLLSDAGDVQSCQYNPAYNDGSYRFEGALVVNGTVYDHIFYRIKGQNSTFNTGKNKWKFKFNRSHYLRMPDDYGLSTTEVETLNISSVPAPWAPWNRGLHGLDEAMAFRLSNLAGVPAPRTSYLQLRVIDGAQEQSPSNQYDGDFWGLYLAFENTDNNFKEEHGLPDGNIFRLIGNESGNRVLGQGKGQPADLSDLNAFTSLTTGYRLGGGTATVPPLVTAIQPEAWFRANVNLPEYFTWRAVTEAINQTDRREQENVVYFRDPNDGRWQILPWDCDLLYENFDRWGPQSVQTSANLMQYEQISRCLLHPAILTEFQNRARELQDLLLNSDQAWKVVDEFISLITDEAPRIIPNGGAINDGFVEAERRRWDYAPTNPTPPRGAGPVGNYYKTPYPIGNMTNGPYPQPYNRVLASGDFEGMVKWVKEFIATGQNGGARLTKMANGETAPYTLTATPAVQIPQTPVIAYGGPGGFPLNQLQFTSSAFSSPNGQSFAAMQWRIGEVYDPSVAGFTAGEPWRYEITGVWNPSESAAFSATTSVPATGLAAGRTYRARVRHKDSAGRWSHWSAPLEFQAGAAVPGDLAANLVISEIMYNPPAPEGSDAEYLELMNIHPSASLDLTGVQFTQGITFSFAPDTILAPGGRLLVVRNAAVFTATYGAGRPVAGEYQFNAQNSLANDGERLVLSLGGATPLRDFTYDNSLPWPETPDNGGASLVLVAPQTNPDHSDPLNWRASTTPNPGTTDALPFTGNPAADSDHDGFSDLMEYAMGPNPVITHEVTPDGLVFTLPRVPNADDALIRGEASTALTTWISADLISSTPSSLTFRVPSSLAAEPRIFIRGTVQLR